MILENIYVGQGVTQRTDFKEVEFLNNSDTKMRAEQQIIFKPGTHVYAGATLHAKIEDYTCVSFQGMIVSGINEAEENSEKEDFSSIQKENQFIVFPNPSENDITIKSKKNKAYSYLVYDLSGQMLFNGTNEKETILELKKGIYIIKTQSNENTETHKVIVR